MNVYFMRHGETDWNTEKRLQGTTDIPLNKNGEELAKITSQNIKNEGIRFEKIYTSPLCRAIKTAEYMNEGINAPLIIDNRIKEFNFGSAEGHTFQEITTDPQFGALKNWFLDPQNYKAEQGSESYEDFFGRLSDFLDNEIKPLEKEGKLNNILIVCHGGVVRGLCKIMLNWDLKHFSQVKIPNCGVNLFTLNQGSWHEVYTARQFYDPSLEKGIY